LFLCRVGRCRAVRSLPVVFSGRVPGLDGGEPRMGTGSRVGLGDGSEWGLIVSFDVRSFDNS